MLKLYMAFCKVTFLTQLEYRGEYFVRTISKIIGWGSQCVLLIILLSRVKNIGGWSNYEILLLYAMNILCYAFAATFVMNGFERLSANIRLGTFDSVLTKPVNPLLYYICQNISAGFTANYALGLTVMAVCIAMLDVTLTPVKLVMLVLSVIGGSLIHAAAFMAAYTPAFWMTENKGIYRVLSSFEDFVGYPINIYPKLIQAVLTFILPFAFVSFYPIELFLDKSDTLLLPTLPYIAPLAGVVAIILAYIFWLVGLKNYKSTGS